MSVTEPFAGTTEIFCGAVREIIDDAEDEDGILLAELILPGGSELEPKLLIDWLDMVALEGTILTAEEAGLDDAGVLEPPPEPPQDISVNNIKKEKNRTISDEKFIATPWNLFSAKMVTSAVRSK